MNKIPLNLREILMELDIGSKLQYFTKFRPNKKRLKKKVCSTVLV